MNLITILNTSFVLAFFLVIFIGIFYLMNYKNVQNRKKYLEQLHLNLKPGKKIEFCGGIYGTITKVNGDTVDVTVSKDNVITISRFVITKILE